MQVALDYLKIHLYVGLTLISFNRIRIQMISVSASGQFIFCLLLQFSYFLCHYGVLYGAILHKSVLDQPLPFSYLCARSTPCMTSLVGNFQARKMSRY